MEYSTRGQYSKLRNYVSNYSLLDNHKFSSVTFPYNKGNYKGDQLNYPRCGSMNVKPLVDNSNPLSRIIIPDIDALDVNTNINYKVTPVSSLPSSSLPSSSLPSSSLPSSTPVCNSSSCSIGNQVNSSSPNSSSPNLLPILDPMFNLKEVSKHLILLEDHLFQQGRRCKDCIIKHMYTIEAFLEEAITLDTNGENVKLIEDVYSEFKNIEKEIINVINSSEGNAQIHSIAQRLRNIRKPLMHKTINLKYE